MTDSFQVLCSEKMLASNGALWKATRAKTLRQLIQGYQGGRLGHWPIMIYS